MRVHEIMSREWVLVDPATTISEVAKRMSEEDVGALPVGKDDRLVGMVSDRDIALRALARGHEAATPVEEVMSEGVYYCFEDDRAEEAAALMAKRKVQRLPVLNSDKRLTGMLALSDLARSDPSVAAQALMGIGEPTAAPREG